MPPTNQNIWCNTHLLSCASLSFNTASSSLLPLLLVLLPFMSIALKILNVQSTRPLLSHQNQQAYAIQRPVIVLANHHGVGRSARLACVRTTARVGLALGTTSTSASALLILLVHFVSSVCHPTNRSTTNAAPPAQIYQHVTYRMEIACRLIFNFGVSARHHLVDRTAQSVSV